MNNNVKRLIPTHFFLFGSKIDIEWDNKSMNDKRYAGQSDSNIYKITLSENIGINAFPEDKILDVFYHEKVHMILNHMEEDKLSSNEKFVELFAKLLRQSDISSVYKQDVE